MVGTCAASEIRPLMQSCRCRASRTSSDEVESLLAGPSFIPSLSCVFVYTVVLYCTVCTVML